MTKRIFISYRRDDSAHFSGRVFDKLRVEFGEASLFMDVATIPFGADFVEILGQEVAKCDVLLAVIGPGWLDAKEPDGTRRLDNSNDFVRIEIAEALRRGIPVVPILLEGTRIPQAVVLPADLTALSRRHALEVRHSSFHPDMDKLVGQLKGAQSKPAPAPVAPKIVVPAVAPALIVSKPAIIIPTADEVIAAKGRWVKEFRIDTNKGSKTPDIFGHYFLRSEIAASPYQCCGSIMSGETWTGDFSMWKLVHGYAGSVMYVSEANQFLTYLGPTWRPEYAALSDAVFKKMGGVPLERFITHP